MESSLSAACSRVNLEKSTSLSPPGRWARLHFEPLRLLFVVPSDFVHHFFDWGDRVWPAPRPAGCAYAHRSAVVDDTSSRAAADTRGTLSAGEAQGAKTVERKFAANATRGREVVDN